MSAEQKSDILYLMSDLGGGTGNHLLQMLEHRDLQQWPSSILSTRHLTSRMQPKVPVEFLHPRIRFNRYPLSQFHQFQQTREMVKRNPPSILHSYFFWPIIYGRLLKKFGYIPLLVENREDQGFNWGMHEYALLKLTRSLPDRVVCVSEAVQKTVIQREKIDPDRTVVIHNGVVPRTPAPCNRRAILNELGLMEKHLIVGMVANLNRPVKAVDYFIRAVPYIAVHCPLARFVIFGRGKLEEELKELARALGIEEYVVFAGYREDVERFYSVMHISVLTSLSEGLSITLLESMNYGLPVVVTEVGGNPEVVLEGETGFLVPPQDVRALVDKLLLLLVDRSLAEKMGKAGRERVAESFSIHQTAENYLAVYREMLGE